LKDYLGPLVPNKTQGKRLLYMAMVTGILALIVIRFLTKCVRKHVLLLDDDEEEETE